MNDTTARHKPCFIVQVEEDYGTIRLAAHPAYMTSDGIRTISWTKWHLSDNVPNPELAGFVVTAYVGPSLGMSALEAEKGVWGRNHRYGNIYSIDDVAYATGIAKTLRKVETGLDKLAHTDGYLAYEDYAGYVIRIAKVLRIAEFYVAPLGAKVWPYSGERYKKVDAASLQSWVKDVDTKTREGQRGTLICR